jgi:hypothetical protein
MEATTNAERERCMYLKLYGKAVMRLRMHEMHLSNHNGFSRIAYADIVQDLICSHIPEYELVEDERVLVSPQASAAGTLTTGAKSRGSKRDGQEQAERARGRARG